MARSRAGPASLVPSGVSPRREDAGSTFPSPALAQARRCSLSRAGDMDAERKPAQGKLDAC